MATSSRRNPIRINQSNVSSTATERAPSHIVPKYVMHAITERLRSLLAADTEGLFVAGLISGVDGLAYALLSRAVRAELSAR